MNTYNFRDCFNASNQIDKKLLDKAARFWPGSVALHKTVSKMTDFKGIDYFLENESSRILNIDMKVREKDYGNNDLAIETWSCKQKQIPGWSRDFRKQTDYVCWIFKDTESMCWIPFLPLVAVVTKNWQDWLNIYKKSEQQTPIGNGDYLYGECIFVPKREIWKEIYYYCNR